MKNIFNGVIVSLFGLLFVCSSALAGPIPSGFTFDRDMKIGDRSKDVEYLQIVLSYQQGIYPEGLITGYFGNLTAQAVKRIQGYQVSSTGTSKVTGYIDASTREYLNEILKSDSPDNPSIAWFKNIADVSDNKAYSVSLNFLTTSPVFQEVKDYELPGLPRVAIIVNSQLSNQITKPLAQYFQDLNKDGYSVIYSKWESGNYQALRSYLQQKYSEKDSLKGAVLVGDLPVVWYQLDNDFYGPTSFPTDIYYSDLDGDWFDNDGDSKLDSHSGDNLPDIWVGRLLAHNLTLSGDSEVSLLQNYFRRNHEYRTSGVSGSGHGLSYVDKDWQQYNSASLELAYGDVTTVNQPSDVNEIDYEIRRLPSNYDFIHVMVHSNPSLHVWSNGGYTTNTDIRTIDRKAYFYNLFACSATKYTADNYLGGYYIFKNNGLVLVGSSKSGSMLGFSEFYKPFGEGQSFGDAYYAWWQFRDLQNLNDERWFLGLNLLGDPTLQIVKSAGTSTLKVNSQVDGVSSSGVTILNMIGDTTKEDGITPYEKKVVGGINTMTLRAPVNNNNQSFVQWGGCDSVTGRDCVVAVKEGDKKIITVKYKTTELVGVCGAAHKQGRSTKPVSDTDLCATGTPSTIYGTGPWIWTCAGYGNGNTVSCFAYKTQVSECTWSCGTWGACLNGVQTRTCSSSPSGCSGSNPNPTTRTCSTVSACGSAHGTSTVITPTSGLCSSGNASNVSASGDRWLWTCGSESCFATDPNATFKAPFAATEMPTFTGSGSSPDTAEVWLQWFCSSGFPATLTISQNYEQVSCAYGSIGSHGGCPGCVMSKFTLKKKDNSKPVVNGVCGSANGQSFGSKPSSGLCSTGTPEFLLGIPENEGWKWVCRGNDGGSDSGTCSATLQTVSACDDISPVSSGGTVSCNNCGGWYGSPDGWAGDGVCAQNNDSEGYCIRDLGSSRYITRITYSGDCTPHNGCRFSLQGSNDGSNWVTLHGDPSTTSGTYTATVNDSYRYIRQNKSSYNWFIMDLKEICTK